MTECGGSFVRPFVPRIMILPLCFLKDMILEEKCDLFVPIDKHLEFLRLCQRDELGQDEDKQACMKNLCREDTQLHRFYLPSAPPPGNSLGLSTSHASTTSLVLLEIGTNCGEPLKPQNTEDRNSIPVNQPNPVSQRDCPQFETRDNVR